jgi:hypothetical protein
MATPTNLPAAFTTAQVLTSAQMNDVRGAFRILQVVSTSDRTARTTTSDYPVTSGMTVSITPQSTSSKIFLLASISFNATGGTNTNKIILAGLSVGSGSVTPIYDTRMSASAISADWFFHGNMSLLHSPNSTSTQVYNILYGRYSAGFDNTVRINTASMPGATAEARSTFTAFEISA